MTDIESLRDIASRYARIVDRREFDRLAEIMVPNAVVAVYPGDPDTHEPWYSLDGLENIQQSFGLLRQYDRTFHFVGQQLITELAADSATGETYCIASHFHTKNGVDHAYVMYIRYQDHFVRHEGSWKIATRQLAVDRTEGEDVDR